jgi:hypothetical protein
VACLLGELDLLHVALEHDDHLLEAVLSHQLARLACALGLGLGLGHPGSGSVPRSGPRSRPRSGLGLGLGLGLGFIGSSYV